MKVFAITTFSILLVTAVYLTIYVNTNDKASFEQENDFYEAKNNELVSSSNDENAALNSSIKEGKNSPFENIDDDGEDKLQIQYKKNKDSLHNFQFKNNDEEVDHHFQLEHKISDTNHNFQLEKRTDNQEDALAVKHGVPEEFTLKNSEDHTTNIEGHTSNNEQVNYYREEIVTTSASIKQNYEEKFEALETTAIEEVTNMVELAMDDYRSKKQNGENISYFYFFRTYYPKVTALQNEIDTNFAKKYNDLQEELEKHGYSPEKAERFKEEFEEKKNDLMKQMKRLVGQVL